MKLPPATGNSPLSGELGELAMESSRDEEARKRRHYFVALLMAAVACTGPSDSPQSTMDIAVVDSGVHRVTDDPNICTECIHLDSLVAFGDTVGPGFINTTRWVVRDSRGRFWAGQPDGTTKIYSAQGAYLRSVGRKGQGPLEFQAPQPAFGDSLGRVYIFDPPQRRISVVSSTYELVDEIALPGPVRAADILPSISGSTRYVANLWLPSGESSGMPLHLVDDDNVTLSFGDVRVTGAATAFTNRRLIASGPSGWILSSHEYDFFIEIWSASGDPLGAYERPAFNARRVLPNRVFDLSFLPNSVMAVQMPVAGQVWIVWAKVRPDWRNGVEEVPLPSGGVGLKMVGDVQDLFQTVIEVLDVRTSTIVARRVLEGHLNTFAGPSLIVENRGAGSGDHPRVVVWSVTLTGGGS